MQKKTRQENIKEENMKQLITIFFAVFCISQSFGDDCATLEVCVENIPKALQDFSKYARKEILDSVKQMKEINKHVIQAVEKFNKEVENGNSKCENFRIHRNRHIIAVRVIRSCGIEKFDKEVKKELKDLLNTFPKDFMYETDVEKKREYCEPLVKVANFYCNRMNDRKKKIQECDITQQFEQLFRKDWEDCISEN